MSQPSQSAAHPQYIWFNGKLVPWQDAQVHVMSHALHYGSSVFEGVRAYDTPKGTCIFRLQEHTRRLFDSAKIYWMDVPYSESEVNEACRTVVRENGLKSGYLRPLAFVGNVGLGLHPPLDAKADLMVAALPWGAYLGEEGLKTGWMCASPPGTGSLPTPSRPVPRRGATISLPSSSAARPSATASPRGWRWM